MMRLLLVLSLLGTLSACTSWPQDGHGGLAERRPIVNSELQAAVDRFEGQRQRGAERLAAGLSDETKTVFVRAQRNHAAGIADDFIRDLAHLNGLLDQIERHISGR